MAIGGPGEVGPRVQGAVEEGPREGAGLAPIQPPRMEDVLVRGPLLSQELVATLPVWCQFMVTGEPGALGTVPKPAEVASSTGAALVPTQPLGMVAASVKETVSRRTWRRATCRVVQLMVSGDHGANGPFVLRPVEGVTQERPELVPTQHLRMVAVPVKEPTSRRKVVTSSSAQLMVSGVNGASGRLVPGHAALESR